MATSLKHQESENTSSHPNSTPTPPPIVQQRLQSMVATIADLTQQNQELTNTVDNVSARNTGKIQRMEGQRTVLREEISPKVPSLIGYHT